MIREHSGEQSYSRGRGYYRRDAVGTVERRGRTLSAKVAGSDVRPYRVDITFDDDGVVEADCTCPYDYGDWCKHIVAVLLTVRDSPELVAEPPSITGWLEPLSAPQLRAALSHLADHHPDIIPTLSNYLADTTPPSTPSQQRRPVIDLALFQTLTRAALRNSHVDWDGFLEFDELIGVLAKVDPLLNEQDYLGALSGLETIADTIFVELEDEGVEFFQIDTFFQDYFDAYFAEAALGGLFHGEIDSDEWARLQDVVAGWQTEAGHDGEYAFNTSEAVLETGWDDPVLGAVLRGERDDLPLRGYDEQEIVELRLVVLGRTERHDDYLNLARAAGFESAYLRKLIESGNVDEALARTKQTLTRFEDAFAVAKTLHERGDEQQALEVAEHGLELSSDDYARYSRYELARWTRDLAEHLGEHTRALRAARLALSDRPSLADYQVIETMVTNAGVTNAGEVWSDYRNTLLSALRAPSRYGEEKIAIFLYEGLVDDAVAVASADGVYLRNDTTARVLHAATETHPDWVIEHATALAEPIMDAKRSQQYQDAARWLGYAKHAYAQSGRDDAWQQYLAQVKERYQRQRKLMGLLKAL